MDTVIQQTYRTYTTNTHCVTLTYMDTATYSKATEHKQHSHGNQVMTVLNLPIGAHGYEICITTSLMYDSQKRTTTSIPQCTEREHTDLYIGYSHIPLYHKHYGNQCENITTSRG